MRKTLLLLALIYSSCLVAQTKVSHQPSNELKDSTSHGTPNGKTVSKDIGSAGGSIVSEDGRMELVFPVGALTATTTISIQPSTNTAPNGSGNSYKFEPSGIEFKKPVELILHYTEEEFEECHPSLMGFAMQNGKGKWSFFDYSEWDSTGRKLKGLINHFSWASNIKRITVVPDKEELRVSGTTKIHIWDVIKSFDDTIDAFLDTRHPVHYFVNGVEIGNKSVGFINTETKTDNYFQNFREKATYTAPVNLPMNNPVTIRIEIYGHNIFTDKMVRKWFQCKIAVFDEYEMKVTAVMDNTSHGIGTLRFVDTATCRFNVRNIPSKGQKKPIMLIKQKVTNTLLILEKNNCPKKCVCEYMSKDYCVGPLNLIGLEDIDMPYGDHENGIATASFSGTSGQTPLMKITCHQMSSFSPVLTTPNPFALPFKFKCIDDEQVQEHNDKNIVKITFRIRRVKGE